MNNNMMLAAVPAQPGEVQVNISSEARMFYVPEHWIQLGMMKAGRQFGGGHGGADWEAIAAASAAADDSDNVPSAMQLLTDAESRVVDAVRAVNAYAEDLANRKLGVSITMLGGFVYVQGYTASDASSPEDAVAERIAERVARVMTAKMGAPGPKVDGAAAR